MAILHITNGDFAADLIRSFSREDEVLAWRDVLFEGPLLQGKTNPEWREMRARYLSDAGYDSFESIYADLLQQEQKLALHATFREIILWFEHDTYDQLQLVQILNWFAQHAESKTQLGMISIDRHPAVNLFLGFGQLSSKQMFELLTIRKPVTHSMFFLARKTWQALTAPDPQQLETLITTDLSALPFLKNALLRYLSEFPSLENGLTYTEQFILQEVSQGILNLGEIFSHLPTYEKEFFLGISDSSFLNIIKRLIESNTPLLRVNNFESKRLDKMTAELTEQGRGVLSNQTDWIELNGIDRWLGGIHLTSELYWRWDKQNAHLVKVSL